MPKRPLALPPFENQQSKCFALGLGRTMAGILADRISTTTKCAWPTKRVSVRGEVREDPCIDHTFLPQFTVKYQMEKRHSAKVLAFRRFP